MDGQVNNIPIEFTENSWGLNVSSQDTNLDNKNDVEVIGVDPNEDEQLSETDATSDFKRDEIDTDLTEPGDIEDDSDNNDDTTIDENFIKSLANQVKSEGYLPEDFEFKDGENVSLHSIKEAFIQRNRESIKSEIYKEVGIELQNAGINESNISTLRALENNVPLDEIYLVDKYRKLSTLKEDTDKDSKLKSVKEMYTARNLDEDEIDNLVSELEIDDDKLNSAFEKSTNYFLNAINNFDSEQVRLESERVNKLMAIRKENETILDKAINKGELYNEKLSPTEMSGIKSAINNKDTTIVHEGKEYKVGAFEEHLYKFNNSFEYQLYLFKLQRFKDLQKDKIKKEINDENNKDFLSSYERAIKKQTKSIKKKEEGKSYTYEFPINR